MDSFANSGAAVRFIGDTPLGPVYQRDDVPPPLGSRVRVIADPDLLRGYVTLHQEAHLWIHEDLVHDIWHALAIVEPSTDVGADYAIMRRPAGAPEPAPDPLLEAVAALAHEAATPRDRFIAALVQRRLAEPGEHVVYDTVEQRFCIGDLDPTPDELRAWLPLIPQR